MRVRAVRIYIDAEVRLRYAECAIPCLPELIAKADDWIFYPVCRLEPAEMWSIGRAILLGDAADGVCVLLKH